MPKSQPTTAPKPAIRPVLKWTGGKQRLLKYLLPLLPSGARLIEPFVGAGSVFLATDYPAYVLNDANPDLVATWVALKERPGQYSRDANDLFREANRTRERFLQIRHEFNTTADTYRRSVLLPYLNKFGFNGLYRVNRSGGFNVPYGNPQRVPLFPFDAAAAASEHLKRATVFGADFATAMAMAGAGDIVYCDPPYLSSERGASFSSYTSAGFGESDHLRLVEAAHEAVGRGATVLISNHDTVSTRRLYRGFEIFPLQVGRCFSAKVESREKCRELVARLLPPVVNHLFDEFANVEIPNRPNFRPVPLPGVLAPRCA